MKTQTPPNQRRTEVALPPARPAVAKGAVAVGAMALGALAAGAFAAGAVAIGALAIGKLAVGKVRIGSLEVGELTVHKLNVKHSDAAWAMAFQVQQFNHLVLTVRDLGRTCDFYQRGLGMEARTKDGRTALHFGDYKFNLHEVGHEIAPHAAHPTPGSADFCLMTNTPLDEVVAHLQQENLPVELGPVRRDGATGPILSVYLRDPDQNLVEISNQLPG